MREVVLALYCDYCYRREEFRATDFHLAGLAATGSGWTLSLRSTLLPGHSDSSRRDMCPGCRVQGLAGRLEDL